MQNSDNVQTITYSEVLFFAMNELEWCEVFFHIILIYIQTTLACAMYVTSSQTALIMSCKMTLFMGIMKI
jgi:hypothetical protein